MNHAALRKYINALSKDLQLMQTPEQVRACKEEIRKAELALADKVFWEGVC
jgi:hypothetical protein